MNSLAPENDEDASEKSDEPWNKTEVESEHGNQANENQIDASSSIPMFLVKVMAS